MFILGSFVLDFVINLRALHHEVREALMMTIHSMENRDVLSCVLGAGGI